MAGGGNLVTVISADASPLGAGLDAAASRVTSFAQSTTQRLAQIQTQFGALTIPKALGGASPIVNAFVAGSVGGPAAAIGSAIGTATAGTLGKLAPGVGGIIGAVIGSMLAEAARSVLALFRAGIEATLEADKAQRGLRQAIAAGGVGLSFRDVLRFADERQEKTNFGDDETVRAAALLGGAQNIRGDAFRRALAAAQDVATFFEMDLMSATRLLARALNDPARGLGILHKLTIDLTDAQRRQLDAAMRLRDVQAAQAVLLEATEQSGVAGAAEAQREPLVQLRNVIGDVVEVIGQGLIPWVREFAVGMKGLLSPLAAFGRPLRDLSESAIIALRSLMSFGVASGALDVFGEVMMTVAKGLDVVSFVIRNFADIIKMSTGRFVLFLDGITAGLIPNAVTKPAAEGIAEAMRSIAEREREFRNPNPGKGPPGFDGGPGAGGDQLRTAGAFERNTGEAFQAITDAINASKAKATEEAIEQHGADAVEELVGLRRDVQGLRGAILRGQVGPVLEIA